MKVEHIVVELLRPKVKSTSSLGVILVDGVQDGLTVNSGSSGEDD